MEGNSLIFSIFFLHKEKIHLNNHPKKSAKIAGLHYVNENDLCIRRIRKGKGFTYLDEKGKIIKNEKKLERFKSLVIPPAWENVLICDSEKGHIQATGRDAKRRKQYIYHPRWDEVRNETKFERMIDFGKTLPSIRKKIEKDLRNKKLSRSKVLALIIKLLEETLIRIGNEEYAKQNNSYGLTTLRDKHIKVKGHTLKFFFNGKSGKETELDFSDKRLAKLVKQCQDLPGQQLFQYIDEDGNIASVESLDVNEYLTENFGKDFTAKDFRTWGGTVIAVEELYHMPVSETEKEKNKNMVNIVKIVSRTLNNTPVICRKYYIHPDIFNAYRDDYLFKAVEKASKIRKSKYSLNTEEMAAILILKKYSNKK